MFTSINPATGEQVGTYREIDRAEVENRLDKARLAFTSWRQSHLKDRQALLSRIADNFETNKQRLAHMATLEMGKTLASAVAEVEKCVAAFRYLRRTRARLSTKYADRAPEWKACRDCLASYRYDTGDHAMELPLLAGRKVYRSNGHGRQHRSAEAREQCPGLCSADRGNGRDRWRTGRRVSRIARRYSRDCRSLLQTIGLSL